MNLTRWLLLIALAAAGVQSCRLADEQAAHANTRAERAQERERAATALAKEQDRHRATENTLAARILEDAHETQNRLDQQERDLAAAGSVAERLRRELAAARARGQCAATADPTTAAPGGAAESPVDLHTELQRRLDEAADGIAGFADRAAEAGGACQRAYERARQALKPNEVMP